MTPKAFYQNYRADDSMSELNYKLIDLISKESPQSIFEFGCGSGKNLQWFPKVVTCGLDVSPQNIIVSHYRNKLPFVILGDESNLGHLSNFDVAFTCSVLDHIEYITPIISELKRMARIIFVAEADWHAPDRYYWSHDYGSFGFEKLDFSWIGEDGATYFIWKYAR